MVVFEMCFELRDGGGYDGEYEYLAGGF